MTDASASPDASAAPPDPPEAPVPLLELSDGLPAVIDTTAALVAYAEKLAAGTGPVAIDAERASGYRYSARAYLVQVRRENAGTALIDPVDLDGLAPLQEAIGETEWILHAATQDLACLKAEGLVPHRLFDTELAGRLLGHPRVGLATLVENLLGRRLRKEHSAVDWSTRPLPGPWLEYAALDVEPLAELRDVLAAELDAAGKTEWARQEFENLLSFEPTVRAEPWRKVSGTHRLKGRRSLGAVRSIWETRDDIARSRDVSPGRVLPDTAIVAAAEAMPSSRSDLLATPGFRGRGADRYASRWLGAIKTVASLSDDELPVRTPRGDGPPPPRAWADRDPVAARRLAYAREAVTARAEDLNVPVENLLTPDLLRRLLWTPPRTRESPALDAAVTEQLSGYRARAWQIDLVTPIAVAAIIHGDREPEPEPVTDVSTAEA